MIAAGKPFQGNQLAPHMLTAQGKQVLQGQAGKELASYYLCKLKYELHSLLFKSRVSVRICDYLYTYECPLRRIRLFVGSI